MISTHNDIIYREVLKIKGKLENNTYVFRFQKKNTDIRVYPRSIYIAPIITKVSSFIKLDSRDLMCYKLRMNDYTYDTTGISAIEKLRMNIILGSLIRPDMFDEHNFLTSASNTDVMPRNVFIPIYVFTEPLETICSNDAHDFKQSNVCPLFIYKNDDCESESESEDSESNEHILYRDVSIIVLEIPVLSNEYLSKTEIGEIYMLLELIYDDYVDGKLSEVRDECLVNKTE